MRDLRNIKPLNVERNAFEISNNLQITKSPMHVKAAADKIKAVYKSCLNQEQIEMTKDWYWRIRDRYGL